jgi:WD40 repeat protein
VIVIARRFALLGPLALVIACRGEPNQPVYEIEAQPFATSDWSEPVNLGPVINSPASEQNATLSPDGLSLYFTSNRSGTSGPLDIWVSRRACTDMTDTACDWQTPANLGPVINSPGADFAPNLSLDGHLLFFSSNKVVGGNVDIYLSHRDDPDDDFAWGVPLLLGPDVNTATQEQAPMYRESAEDGTDNLYFNRGVQALGQSDIYVAGVTRDGDTRGPAQLVAELSVPNANDAGVTVRTDGRELMFFSTRPGGLGLADLWVSTRSSVHEPWSPPENPGAPLNSSSNDLTPSLSFDGRTLVFASDRPGGFGGNDLYMSTRTPSGSVPAIP